MKRYYLSDVIGDGFSPETAFRPALAIIPGLNYASEMRSDPITGKPLDTFALCIVTGNKHGFVMADSRNTALPDVSLDVKINAISVGVKNKFKADVTKVGLDSTFIDNSDGYRDAIRALGQKLNPNFNENNFDVSE